MKNLTIILLLLFAACRCKEDPCENNTCSNGNICKDGLCECPPELVKIGKRCVNLKQESSFQSFYVNYLPFRCLDTIAISIKYSEDVDTKFLEGGILHKEAPDTGFYFDLFKKPDGDSIFSYAFVGLGLCRVNGQPGFANLHAKFSPDKKVLKGEMHWYYYTSGLNYVFYDKDPVLFTKEK